MALPASFTGRGLAHFPGEFARGASFCQEVVQRGSRENVPVPLAWPVNGYCPQGWLRKITITVHSLPNDTFTLFAATAHGVCLLHFHAT